MRGTFGSILKQLELSITIECFDAFSAYFPDTLLPAEKKEILLILFEFKNRNSSYEVQALIEKKSSPIDTSYFFYAVNFPPTNKLVEGYFEFFPPSHLLLKKGTHQFDNLACWK